jgi:hypothetical protein
VHLHFEAETGNSGFMTQCYGFRQTIDATFPVPGTVASRAIVKPERQIRIRETRPHDNAGAPLYARAEQTLVFSAPGVATYRCRLDSIELAPCPQASRDEVIGLLLATALPATQWLQGKYVLHAAGVVLAGADEALAIVGPSGAGKSFLAAQLLAQGARLLGDDSLALELTDAGVMASGLPGGLYRRIDQGAARRFDAVLPGQSVESAPLGAIIVLGDGDERIELNQTAALEQLIANQHRPRIPAALGRVGVLLAQAAAIAQQVPVSLWPRGMLPG